MKIDEQVIVTTDVDGTLVRRIEGERYDGEVITVINPYDGIAYKYAVHTEHVELIKQYAGRGFFNIVWSANGVGHAESIAKKLGLYPGVVNLVMTKPMKHLDDKRDAEFIVGSHVFIPREGFTNG